MFCNALKGVLSSHVPRPLLAPPAAGPTQCVQGALPVAKCPLLLFSLTFVSSYVLSGGKDDTDTLQTQNVA